MAEGAGLLNRYTVKSRIGGSNPPLSAKLFQVQGSSSHFPISSPSPEEPAANFLEHSRLIQPIFTPE